MTEPEDNNKPWIPDNVDEFEQGQFVRDVLDDQKANQHLVQNHPIYGPLQDAIGHVHRVEAQAQSTAHLGESWLPDEIRSAGQQIRFHLNQLGHGVAHQMSAWPPGQHLHEAGRILGWMTNETHHNDSLWKEGKKHLDRLGQISFGQNYPKYGQGSKWDWGD
jgi:hypothetical protein